MTFINEKFSEQDADKFEITEDSNFYLAGATQWTIDRDRDIFLVHRAGGGPEQPAMRGWAFHWKGRMISVWLEGILLEIDANGHGIEHTRLQTIEGVNWDIGEYFDEIVCDLKEALTARKGSGIYSSSKSYEVVLEVSSNDCPTAMY